MIADLKRFIIYENRYSNIEEVFQKVVNQRRSTQDADKPSEQPKLPAKSGTSQNNAKNQWNPESQLPERRVLRVREQNNQTSFTSTLPRPTLEVNNLTDRLRSNENYKRGPIPIPPTIPCEPTLSSTVCPAPRSVGTATTVSKRKNKLIIRNTPTDLFQFYQKGWERFRHLLPGENSRSSVRAEVRKRMEHQPPPKPKVYLRFEDDQKKTMTTHRLGRREM